MGSLWFCSCFFIMYASVCLLFFVTGTYSVTGNETDRQALFEFKARITADQLGVMSSWNGSTHFCKWYGVTCDRQHQRVTILNLTSSKLAGTISPHIGNLSFLKALYLTNNSFTHNIPPEIGHLQRLQMLYLYNNSLTGEIPSNISTCSSLVRLLIGNNKLTGKLPVEIGYLSQLQILSVWGNNLNGIIPPSLGNLSSLFHLDVSLNNLVGNIPDTFVELQNLTNLILYANNLSGTVSSSISNLSSLTDIDIGINNFVGFIPADLFTSLTNLQYFSFGQNQFSGVIPNSISNASNLVFLQLSTNHLIGKVPSFERMNLQWLLIYENELGDGEIDDLRFLCSLTNSTILQELYIGVNNFGGSLPECIGNLSSTLQKFSSDDNQISGGIPTNIVNLVNLDLIEVYNNMISGIIPQSIGNLQRLVMLDFERNRLFGPIPFSLGNLTNLIKLSLHQNNLQGTIPSSLANCTNLRYLDFSANNLSGTLPPQIVGLSSLSIFLSFAQNSFTGSLPIEVGNLKALSTLDVSYNRLLGEIPTSLGSCTSLGHLYLNDNHFQGSIPFSLSSLTGLQIVDFSHNNLSGQIPSFFAKFDSLLVLNLSYNHFNGVVPINGAFKNASITSIIGNDKLCGGIPEYRLPICDPERNQKMRRKVIIAIMVGISGASLVLLTIMILLCFKMKRNKKTSDSEMYPQKLPRVSYNDLHRATEGFHSSNLIGTGSFGCVYKGTLNQREGGQPIAVKVLNLQSRGATKSFMAECEALRNIRHRNLVKIVTTCSGIDYQGNDFKALVYEFKANGSLEKWLHPPVVLHEIREGDMNLNLIQRINIAVDVAFAVEYLHRLAGTPIVHCDIKPSNVLLDDELIAYVGDFGLAKFLGGEHNSSNRSSSAGLCGTIGYAPPEYGLGSEVSTQGDTYSYGILLLEIFTGKRPTANMFKEGWNLHKYVESALPEEVCSIVDPILLQERGELENGIIMECLISVLGIGISCSTESPTDRMDISEAVSNLRLVRDKLKDSQETNAPSTNVRHRPS